MLVEMQPEIDILFGFYGGPKDKHIEEPLSAIWFDGHYQHEIARFIICLSTNISYK